jgi:hypothetical protein
VKRLFLIAIISAAPIPAWVQAQVKEITSERTAVAFSDPSRPGLLKVSLFQGGINIKGSDGKEVIVEAKGRRGFPPRKSSDESTGLRRLDQPNPGLTIEENNNEMTIGNSWGNWYGDLDIQVPSKTNLKLNTMNGGLIVEGVEGDIEVTNTNGGVQLTDVSGSVVAHSVNGQIKANLRRVTPQKPMAFTTLNGTIDVTFPADIKANLKMRSDNGGVYTDFDIEMNQTGSKAVVNDSRDHGGRYRLQMDKTIYGAINGGGPDIELRSFNGNVYIRKPQ